MYVRMNFGWWIYQISSVITSGTYIILRDLIILCVEKERERQRERERKRERVIRNISKKHEDYRYIQKSKNKIREGRKWNSVKL